MANTNQLLTGILVTLLLVTLFGFGLSEFNESMNESYSVGLSTDALTDIDSTLGSSKDLTLGGDVEQTDGGLSLTSSWAIGKGLFSVIWDFANGSWINNLMVNILRLGAAGAVVATVLRMIFVGFLIFSVIKLFFKVRL